MAQQDQAVKLWSSHYFRKDGTYGRTLNWKPGDTTQWVFDTSDWTEADWEAVRNCHDEQRLSVANSVSSRINRTFRQRTQQKDTQ